MPINHATAVRSQSALATARTDAAGLARLLSQSISRARTLADPNLSPAGLESKRQEAEETILSAGRTDLEALERRIADAREFMESEARNLFRLPDDPGALLRTDIKWRQVERLLDGGADLRKLISTADWDTLVAIHENAPSYLAAKAPDAASRGLEGPISEWLGGEPHDPAAGIRTAVMRRAEEVRTDLTERMVLHAAANSAALLDPAQPWLTASRQLVDNGATHMLAAAMSSQIAESEHAPAAEPTAA